MKRVTTNVLLLALLGVAACGDQGTQQPPAVANSAAKGTANEPLVLKVSMVGGYEDQPGFLHVDGPDYGSGYNMQADSRSRNYEEMSTRFSALHSTRASASVLVQYADVGDWSVTPGYLNEIVKRLRAAGFSEVELVRKNSPVGGSSDAAGKGEK